MDDMIRDRLALEQEIDSLKQTLSNQTKEKESLLQTFNVFKNKSKEKESKYMCKEIDLEEKIEELDNILNQLSEDFGKCFVPQKELYVEQDFWLLLLNPNYEQPNVTQTPVRVEVPKELPNVSLVNTSVKKLKSHLASFDKVVKVKTIPDAITEGSWGFEHTKKVFNEEVIPFKNSLQTLVKDFENGLLNELNEVKTMFNQMKAVVDQCSVDKKLFEIEKKELELENERLLEHIICQDVVNIVMLADVKYVNVLPVQNTFLDGNIALDMIKMENDRLMELLISQDLVHTTVNSLAIINDYKRPAPQLLTPGYISSGLVQNLVYPTPNVPPSKKDYEILFQLLFDEYFNRLPCVVSPDPIVVAAPRAVDPAGVEEQIHGHQNVQFDNSPFLHNLSSDPSSEETTSQRVIPSNLHHLNQSFNTLTKLTKNHPLENVGDPSRPVSTRSQLQEHVIWCYFGANDNPIPFGGKWSG
ncbi:hypothetical protein Tco_1074839 [Tanacetum coccineum]